MGPKVKLMAWAQGLAKPLQGVLLGAEVREGGIGGVSVGE